MVIDSEIRKRCRVNTNEEGEIALSVLRLILMM